MVALYKQGFTWGNWWVIHTEEWENGKQIEEVGNSVRDLTSPRSSTTLLLIITRDARLRGRATGDVFPLPITPRAPFVTLLAFRPPRAIQIETMWDESSARLSLIICINRSNLQKKMTVRHATGRKDDVLPNRPSLRTNPSGVGSCFFCIPPPPPPPPPRELTCRL